MNKLPLARTADIVVQTLGKEVLIYDLNTHKAYNLNETSAIVYQACDGKTSFDELRTKNNFTDELIFFALDELKKENLIEADHSLISPFNGMSRREVIRKAGLASMIALPVISSLVAPTAAMAQSGCVASGNQAPGTGQSGPACFANATAKCCSNTFAGGGSFCNAGGCTCSVTCF